ncbi:zinc finger SWIM domain-containing protein 7-like isoform X2 [Zootermopsis nevadensis]|uniref:zinc finger SWIM domain-containing protein 7-like isoform X2 n=1 Tax=Zootermopsis nevadensis TaxID=136037 RepID=UPI000B8E8771|nr:zinc finger SWIM domain-containing protein 7-like isoform X2 [Zootermopsis nevadensis]
MNDEESGVRLNRLKQNEVTDEILLALHSLFGKPFEKALELLESSCVVYVRCGQGRYVVQVTGSSGTPYTLFPHVNFCSCPAYRYQVISTQKFLTCKHILAARLAEIMQKGRDLSLSVEELTRILCAAVKFDSDGADHDPWSTHLV